MTPPDMFDVTPSESALIAAADEQRHATWTNTTDVIFMLDAHDAPEGPVAAHVPLAPPTMSALATSFALLDHASREALLRKFLPGLGRADDLVPDHLTTHPPPPDPRLDADITTTPTHPAHTTNSLHVLHTHSSTSTVPTSNASPTPSTSHISEKTDVSGPSNSSTYADWFNDAPLSADKVNMLRSDTDYLVEELSN